MKTVTINKLAEIINGKLKGISGKVVGFDSIDNEVHIKLDDHTSVITVAENIKQ